MGKKRQRQPDFWFNFGGTYPKGESTRLKLAIALLGVLAIITGALITSGILPEALGDAWDRIFDDGPPSSSSSASKSEVGRGRRPPTCCGRVWRASVGGTSKAWWC
jgi:hypothetical protein